MWKECTYLTYGHDCLYIVFLNIKTCRRLFPLVPMHLQIVVVLVRLEARRPYNPRALVQLRSVLCDLHQPREQFHHPAIIALDHQMVREKH